MHSWKRSQRLIQAGACQAEFDLGTCSQLQPDLAQSQRAQQFRAMSYRIGRSVAQVGGGRFSATFSCRQLQRVPLKALSQTALLSQRRARGLSKRSRSASAHWPMMVLRDLQSFGRMT